MLHIKAVKKSDKGSYQCIVKNDVGELSEEVDLVVSKLVIKLPRFLLLYKSLFGVSWFSLVTWFDARVHFPSKLAPFITGFKKVKSS